MPATIIPPSNPLSFLVSWWFTPTTRLGIYFNSFGIDQKTSALRAFPSNGIDATNGMGCSVEELYHWENLITQHPVENTAAISDHIINQPITITVQGIITSMIALPLSGAISFTQLNKATQILIQMAQATTGISLQTGLLYGKSFARFDNLAVQSLDLPRNNEYGRSSLKFTITFRQLILTSVNDGITQAGFSQGNPATVDLFNLSTIGDVLQNAFTDTQPQVTPAPVG